MKRGTAAVCGSVALLVGGAAVDARIRVSPEPPSQSVTAAASQDAEAVVSKYCVTCHNARALAANLDLGTPGATNVDDHPDVWERVVRKLRARAMPPVGATRPDPQVLDRFVSRVESTLDAAAGAHPNPGRPAVHRLNRVEYANAIRDVFGLDIDVGGLLPADDSGYGFDNIADVLTVTPSLLDRYLLAAKKISRLVVGDPTMRPEVQQYKQPIVLLQDDRMSEDLPFGSRGGMVIRHPFPVDADYVIRVRLQRVALGLGDNIRGLDEAQQLDVRLDGVPVERFSIGGEKLTSVGGTALDDSDTGLHVRVRVTAGTHVITLAFLRRSWYAEGGGPTRLPSASYSNHSARTYSSALGKVESAVEAVTIQGPFDADPETPTRNRIFVCHPTSRADESPCARRILSAVARLAWRRPVTPQDRRTLAQFYQEGARAGGFPAGVRRALERVLTDVEFLFRIETPPGGAAIPGSIHRISDLALASRLSFFLWSSIPDDELLSAASSGRLRRGGGLEKEVRRMLADPRSRALRDNFFGQWLYLRNVRSMTPDPRLFPEFNENLRDALEQETRLFLDSQLREDRPVLELLTANYTFLNERLAQHYGIPGVYGSHFRRVVYPDDRRAGLLGQGGVLMVTSYTTRTSPVLRGKWILQNLLGTPPPPPPPNVPPFDEQEGVARKKSIRERMEAHRRNPVCAACHSKMDPLGFALENFDATGRWRMVDGQAAVDASGLLPSGGKFTTPAEFRTVFVREAGDAFVTTVVDRLLTYALGRGTEYYDMPAVRRIKADAMAGGYRWSSLILGVVNSLPFQMRKTES